ncbi:TolC family protein, partial [Singulisphaera rosea]
MILSKLRTTSTTFLALALLATGFGTIAQVAAEDAKGPKDDGRREAPKASPLAASGKSEEAAREEWPLSLREAIIIGLENSEAVRVVSTGTRKQSVGSFEKSNSGDRRGESPFEIAQAKPTLDVTHFRAEIMAHVRSVEQIYWSVVQQKAQLRATEQAVTYAKDILKREQAELQTGRGTVADVAECTQRLEQFQLDLVTKTSDVITTERQLCNILGIQPSRHRIIPTTPPVIAPITPDWNESVRTMLANQPDIVRASDELKDFDADYAAKVIQQYTSQFNSTGNTGPKSKDDGKDDVPSVQAKARKYVYADAIHQYTHILARFFLEIDAGYKQYQTASRLREAAKQRLEAQKSFYEEGRITIDRLLDATSQYASALGTEAQYKTNYNISIAALEEAKGTLLEFDNIKLSQIPASAGRPKADSTVRTTSLEPPSITVSSPPPVLARSDAAMAVSP